MSGFAAEWLALREPLDLAARNKRVEAAYFEALPKSNLKILDLASGAGSTVAALSGRDGQVIRWILADHDPALLAIASQRRYAATPEEIITLETDLASSLEQLPFLDVDAVTTSAFLDLVSENFLQQLADLVTSAGKPFLASLSYDGRASFDPAHPLDEALRQALNSDQQSDKGLGPALGPKAARRAVDLFRSKGYRIEEGESDWQIGPGADAFLAEFLSGWARVGRKQGLDQGDVAEWLEVRHSQISENRLTMTVGHLDFAALPS